MKKTTQQQSSSESSFTRRCRKSKAFGLIFHHSLEQECLEFDGKLAATSLFLTTTGERERERAWQQDHSWPETKMNNSLLTFLPEQKAFFQLVIQCSAITPFLASLRKATGFWLRSILVVENPWLQSLTSVNKDSTLAFFIGVQCPLWSGQ